jgi:quercetin dioxygenase-like cupin family protein
MAIRVFHQDDFTVKVPMIASDARLIVWLGVGAKTANMNYVDMQPEEENVPHIHRESEDTIYILEGRGSIYDFDNDRVLEFEQGQCVHIPIGVKHAVRADRGSRIRSVGGPCPADLDMLKAAGILDLP